MKRKSALLGIAALWAGCAVSSMAYAAEPSPPVLKIKAEAPLQLPDGWNFGEVAGVAVTSKGHVIAFLRADQVGSAYAAKAAQLVEFDQNGKFVREIAHNHFAFSFAEAVRVDKNDNIWIVDKGSNMIVEFGQDGRAITHHSRREEPHEYRPPPSREVNRDYRAPVTMTSYFREPTDIAWDSNGNSYITDGYLDSRVAKWKAGGGHSDVMKLWGDRGTGPGQFYIPHGIAIDAKDNVYVADRGNARIQVFDTEGQFLRQFTLVGQIPTYKIDPAVGNPLPIFMPDQPLNPRGDNPTVKKSYPVHPPEDMSYLPGSPTSICITPPGPNQVLFIGDMVPSRIYKVNLDGKVLGMLGGAGGKLGQFRIPHALACPNEHTLWVADMTNWRVQKITIE